MTPELSLSSLLSHDSSYVLPAHLPILLSLCQGSASIQLYPALLWVGPGVALDPAGWMPDEVSRFSPDPLLLCLLCVYG